MNQQGVLVPAAAAAAMSLNDVQMSAAANRNTCSDQQQQMSNSTCVSSSGTNFYQQHQHSSNNANSNSTMHLNFQQQDPAGGIRGMPVASAVAAAAHQRMLSEPMMTATGAGGGGVLSQNHAGRGVIVSNISFQHQSVNSNASAVSTKSPHFVSSQATMVAGSNPTLACLMTSVANEVNDPLLSSSNAANGVVTMETDPEDDAMLTKLLEECISSNANNSSTSNGMEIYH